MRFDRRKDIHPKYLLLTFTIIGIVLIVLSYAAAPKVAGIRRFTSKLITPIQDDIYEAVKAISQQYGYDLVVDRASAAGIIFANPRIDISDEILRKLGYSN